MRILVAGASGGVGQAVVTMANAWGHEVFALSRKPIHQPVWRHMQVDILNEAALFAAMGSDIDVVISCIGMQRRNPKNPWSPSLSPINLTSMATRSMCRCMKMCGVSRIIALSAAGVAESAARLNVVMQMMLATTMIGTAYADLARMEQVLAKVAYRGEGVLIDADQVDLLRVAISIALEGHHRRERYDRRDPSDSITEPCTDPLFVALGLGDARLGAGFQDDIAKDSMHSILHGGCKSIHDAVDDDERRDAEGHRDDRGQCDPTGLEITHA
jgi:putative NADH-flavin reductase